MRILLPTVCLNQHVMLLCMHLCWSYNKMAIKCKLQELNLSHCFSISDDMVQEIVSQSRLRNNVVRLGMQGVFLSQDAFDMTVTLPHLRVLELFDMERVNDAALRRVSEKG